MKCLFLSLVAALGAVVLADSSSVSRVNGSIEIEAGRVAGDVSTVNGSIHIGANAKVGAVRSVNGGLHLGDGAGAASLSTVNGGIELGQMAQVAADVHSVNGALQLHHGVELLGTLANVNGAITIDGAHVVGRVRTINGGMNIINGARLDGGILVEKPNGSWNFTKPTPPRIVIGAGVVVSGTLKFEREVKLYVNDQVKHIGSIEGATPIKFSGNTPPQ